jgi:hypothetical protein
MQKQYRNEVSVRLSGKRLVKNEVSDRQIHRENARKVERERIMLTRRERERLMNQILESRIKREELGECQSGSSLLIKTTSL